MDAGSSPVGRTIAPAELGFFTHYVIVRADLPLGVIVAQTIHAAGESSPGPGLPTGTRAVALAARNERHLATLEQELIGLDIPHRAIREPDRFNELMAIGIFPVADRTTLQTVTKRLRLLR